MPGAVEDGEHSPEDRAALEEDAESLEELQSRLETVMREKAEVESALEERSRRVATLEASETASAARIRDLIGELESEKERARTMWRLNCDQIARYDTELVERESEVTALRTQLEAEKKRTVSREVEVPPTPTGVERSGPPETGDDSTDLTEPVVPETRKVYPLRSRQRQARGELVGGRVTVLNSELCVHCMHQHSSSVITHHACALSHYIIFTSYIVARIVRERNVC